MLNQFTGIAKIIKKETYWDCIEGCNSLKFTLRLCNEETENEYIFEGKQFDALFNKADAKKFNKYDELNIDDIVAFKGHFDNYSTMIMTIDSLKIV